MSGWGGYCFWGEGGGGCQVGGGVQGRCNREVKFLWKFKKKYFVGGRGMFELGGGGGGQGGCKRRIEVFVIFKKKIQGGGGGPVGGAVWELGMFGLGCQVEVFCENSKKNLFFFFLGGGGSGWRVDVTELKFLRKFTKKTKSGGGGGGIR